MKKKTEIITLRVSESVKQKHLEKAKSKGITLNNHCKQLLEKEAKEALPEPKIVGVFEINKKGKSRIKKESGLSGSIQSIDPKRLKEIVTKNKKWIMTGLAIAGGISIYQLLKPNKNGG